LKLLSGAMHQRRGELDDICVQGTSGGGWCYSHGAPLDPCIELAQVDADGTIPRLRDSAFAIATAMEEPKEPKDTFNRDCLNRVRGIAFTAREGRAMRSESAIIIL